MKNFSYPDEVLKFIYTNYPDEEIPMTRMQTFITSYYSVINAVNDLSNKGLVNKREVIHGRKTIMVSLTEKGCQVAEQLQNAELAAKGTLKRSFFSREQLIIRFLGNMGNATESQIRGEIPGSLDDLRELEGMNLIWQGTGIENINYFRLTQKGEDVFKKIKETENIVKV